jgi:hypothetical protein
MKITRHGITFTLVLAACAAIAQSGKGTESALEIVSIRDNGFDLKLRSAWSYPVAVSVCDATQRLDALGYSVEALKGKRWVQLKPPEDTVSGDLPPTYLEIAPGGIVSLPVLISPTFLGISRGMRLRVVVRAWRSETNLSVIGKSTVHEPFLLASDSFVWTAKP